jgi:hypothetical protein
MVISRKRITFQTGNGDGVGFNRTSNSRRHMQENNFVSDADRYDPQPGRRWNNLHHRIIVGRIDNRWQATCRSCKWVSYKSKSERSVKVAGYRHRFSDD